MDSVFPTPRIAFLLVPPQEVGLLHRLRPAVRAGRRSVLVVLDQAPAPDAVQLGVGWGSAEPGRAPVCQTVSWFGGLTAVEVGEVVRLVAEDRVGEIRGHLADRARPTRTR
ncbi:hypothetical protein ACFFKU_06465 [Kineococcus gynurae]|uniref:Uncharacterized protein n=1 Tax=Kineococcus gynurae TaxID=452979 RepID=A0ABV5LX55_9ACTN